MKIPVMVKSLCVYCASSAKVHSDYLDVATQLGELLAENRVHCIYGAGHVGLMGALADSVLAKNGEITGVIPRFMIDRDWHHKGLEEIITTETMHERKAKMAQLSGAAVALPGGCGTMEELLEIITWKQLGLFPKPIVIVNINGYYDELVAMLKKAIAENFMREEHGDLWTVAHSPEDVIETLKNAADWGDKPLDYAIV